jgi:LuxR family transcriptional regulator, maltose regulon positive regulatory protein
MIEVSFAPLLATKLHVPRPRRALVSRPRLLQQLDEGFERPLTLLVAPPGFGKTTLIAEWIAQSGHRAAWLSLDPGDNDPSRFWNYVIAALETLEPGIGQSALALLDAPQAASMETILTALINAVAACPEEFSLVLDDYHVIESDQIHEAIAFLLSHTPAPMHLILTTRSDPLLPLARLRARDDMVELRAADLRFNSMEAERFFETGMQLSLGPAEVAALEERTEGWIAGLQLAALALRGQEVTQIPDFIAASVSSNRFVVDYLVDEVLQSQPEAVQDFLRQTACLDRLCAGLCDAVTGRNDSQAILEHLEHINLFLIPADPQHEWYRYHNLFGDVLRKLLAQQQPDLLPELHRRASAWYRAHDLTREAVSHALAIPDYENAADLIEETGLATLSRGALVTMQHWLQALPLATLRSRPRLCLYYAAAQTVTGNLDAVEPLLQDAEEGIRPDTPEFEVQDIQGQIAAMRAILAARSGDTTRILELSEIALDCLPESRVFLRGIANWMRGLAYARAGETAAANRTFAATIAMSQVDEDGSAAALSLSTFGFLEMMQGHLNQAHELYQRALQVLNEAEPATYPLAAIIYLRLGELLRLQNHLDRAADCIERGLSLTAQAGNPGTEVHGRISQAWLRQARGDQGAALAALETAIERAAPGDLIMLQAHQARLQIMQGDLEGADQWAKRRMLRFWPDADDPNHRRGRHLEMVTWAHLLIAQGRPADALAVLDRLPGLGSGSGRLQNRLDAMIATSLAYEGQGKRGQAWEMLGEALALAAPEGFVRIFVDNGPGVLALLTQGVRADVWSEPACADFASQLLTVRAAGRDARPQAGNLPAMAAVAAHNGHTAYQPAPSGTASFGTAAVNRTPQTDGDERLRLLEPLSQRELEVLRLAAAGLGNRQIAERLVLSVGTIKSHIHNIYGKLGAQDRAEALAQARDLQLL